MKKINMKKASVTKLTIGIISLALIMVYAISQYIAPPMPTKISIATGSKEGMYYQYALIYQKMLAKEKVELEIIPTAGSVEALRLLSQQKVDFAFMQGGTAGDINTSNIQALASIYLEPLWVFYPQINTLNELSDLQGKKIAIGKSGSGTNAISREILSVNHIDANNSTLIEDEAIVLVKALSRGYIDALFISISASSVLINHLMHDPKINLYPFMQSYAYQKKYPHLSHVTLYPGVIDIAGSVPMLEVPLIASTTSIVTNANTHKKLIRLFMSKLKQVHSQEDIFTPAKVFPSSNGVDMPMNKYAYRYLESGDTWLEKTFPFWIASQLDRLLLLLIPLLTLMIPLIKGLLPLYRWSTRSKIYKWYETLHAINEKTYNTDTQADLIYDIERLKDLRQEVTQEVDVPLSYMGEYYDLQLHIKHVIDKLEEKEVKNEGI